MKHVLLTSAAIIALGLTACSTTDSTSTMAKAESAQVEKAADAKAAETKVAKAEDKKESKKDGKKQKGLSQTFTATPEQVKTATLIAMKKVGFNIKKDGGMKIQGKRSNKIGLAVGSGGEKMYAEILPMEGGQTGVHVRTKKTLVGIVGQKNWDDEVMELIIESLGKMNSATPMSTS